MVLYRGLAEIADQYLRKRAQIYIGSKLRTSKWIDGGGLDLSWAETPLEAYEDDFRRK